ncbi:MAG: GNA1162 family protein [Nitrospiraceae bacterium]
MISKSVMPALALVLCALSSACVNLPPVLPNPGSPVKSIAVLPLVNNSVDVDGPAAVQEALYLEALHYHFPVVKPNAETNQILKDQMSLTLGSQLDMATPQKLGEALGVEAVLYGSLEDFSQKITGIYNVKRVRVRAKLVDCKTGEVLWKNGIGIKQALTAGGSFLSQLPGVNLAIGLAGAASSIASKMSDKSDVALPKFLGDEIEAPWLELPERTTGVEMAAAQSIGGKVISKAMGTVLKEETDVAVNVLFHGYYHQGGLSQPVTYGKMLPTGPGR